MTQINFSSYGNQLLEIYSKNSYQYESESFSLRYIMKALDEFFIFMSISEYGTVESIQIRNKKFVSQIKTNTSYTQIYDYFISYNRNRKTFDVFDLESIYVLCAGVSFEKILSNCMNLKGLASIMAAEENLLTGRIVLFDKNILVLSLLNFENVDTYRKKSLNLNDIVSIDIINIENILLSKYLKYEK